MPGAFAARTISRAAGGVLVRWSASTDDRPGLTYRVLRNDRVVAAVGGRSWIDTSGVPPARYAVVAVDARGNRSAVTPAVVLP